MHNLHELLGEHATAALGVLGFLILVALARKIIAWLLGAAAVLGALFLLAALAAPTAVPLPPGDALETLPNLWHLLQPLLAALPWS